MNTRRMSKDDLAVKAQESKRETKEERQARRKAEIQAANAKRHAEFEAEAQLDSAAIPEQSDAQAADEPAAPAAAAEAVTLSVPVDIFHGLSDEEIQKRNQAVVKIQSRARGVAVRSSDVKEKAAQRKKDAEHAKMEFQRRLMAASADQDHTIAASELGRTAEDLRIQEQLAAAEVNLQLQAQTYADNLRKEADYKKKREEELQHTSAAANDAAIEQATENKANEVLLARQAEIAAQQVAQASMLQAETFYSGEMKGRDVAYVLEDVTKESENQSLKASKGVKNVMFEYNKPARMCLPVQKQALDLIYGACVEQRRQLRAPHTPAAGIVSEWQLRWEWTLHALPVHAAGCKAASVLMMLSRPDRRKPIPAAAVRVTFHCDLSTGTHLVQYFFENQKLRHQLDTSSKSTPPSLEYLISRSFGDKALVAEQLQHVFLK